MKRATNLLIVLLLAIFPTFVDAQYSIRGSVTDSQGNLLVGASIRISNSYLGAISDANGNFTLGGLQKKQYQLTANFIGYVEQTKTIELISDLQVDFKLEFSEILTEEVIVSATRANEKTPIAYTNIGIEKIRSKNLGKDIPFLLELTPSLVSTSDAGTGIGYTGFRIRGTDANRTNVTVNGIPLNDAESHSVFWVNMPDFSSSVQNIQIQRGVGTSTNGAAAFGATVNLQTSALNKTPYTEINASVGSFNTWKTAVNVGTGLLKKAFSFDARLSKVASDGYVDRAESDLKSFFVSGAYHNNNTLCRINIFSGSEKTYQAWNGVPKARLDNNTQAMQLFAEHGLMTEQELEHLLNSNSRTYNFYTYKNEVDNYQQTHYQLLFSHKLNSFFSMNLNAHYTIGKGYYEQFKQNEDYADYGLQNPLINGIEIESTDLIRRKWLDNDFYGFTYSLNYQQNKLNATFGGAWNKYEGEHFGRIVSTDIEQDMIENYTWYNNKGIKTDYNVFAKANYQITEKLNLWGDMQMRKIDYSIDGIHDDFTDLTMETDFTFFNPKIGFSIEISQQQNLFASFAVGNREPSRSQFRDADEGETPHHETLFDYEFGYNFNAHRSMISVNFYYMKYKDQLVLTGEINNVGSAILTNVPNSYRTGIEIVGGIKISDKLSWEANLSVSKNKIEKFTEMVDDWDTGKQQAHYLGTTDLSFSPEIVAASVFSVETFKNFNIELISKYVGKQYIDNTSNKARMLDAYFLNDFKISYLFQCKFAKEIELNFMINNFLNHQYESNAWVYRYYLGGEHYQYDGYFPQAGRHFLGGIRVRF